MEFEYGDDLTRHPGCPPVELNSHNGDVFRFVHEDLADYRNWTPPAKIDPSRQFSSPFKACDALAISIFETREKAAQFYHSKTTPKLFLKQIGHRVARVSITAADGMVTRPARNGHFSLFQARGIRLEGRFVDCQEPTNASS